MSTKQPSASPPSGVEKTDEEWRRELTAEQYRVLRGHGTERAGQDDVAGPQRDAEGRHDPGQPGERVEQVAEARGAVAA